MASLLTWWKWGVICHSLWQTITNKQAYNVYWISDAWRMAILLNSQALLLGNGVLYLFCSIGPYEKNRHLLGTNWYRCPCFFYCSVGCPVCLQNPCVHAAAETSFSSLLCCWIARKYEHWVQQISILHGAVRSHENIIHAQYSVVYIAWQPFLMCAFFPGSGSSLRRIYWVAFLDHFVACDMHACRRRRGFVFLLRHWQEHGHRQ